LFAAQVKNKKAAGKAEAEPYENDCSTLALTSRPFHNTLKPPLSATVRADNVALLNLSFDGTH